MSVRIINGDCLDELRKLPAASVHCCVTSPPYWGLRDYGIPPSNWGGDPACEHEWGESVGSERRAQRSDEIEVIWSSDGAVGRGPRTTTPATCFCIVCGAWRGAFGLEPTPALYVEHTVMVFREVRRVLRDDGTLWLNLGDSYSNDTKWGGSSGGKNQHSADGGYQGQRVRRGNDCDPKRGPAAPGQPFQQFPSGLKPKDLCGIPWRVAFALQADGWYLRQDIIWAKPNPMPESVRDRCTKSHEYIFLLSKSERYYFDADAIAEPTVADHPPGNKTHKGTTAYENEEGEHHRTKAGLVAYAQRQRNNGVGWGYSDDEPKPRTLGTKGEAADEVENRSSAGTRMGRGAGWRDDPANTPATRNKRSVWTAATQPFKGAHFACVDSETEALTPIGWQRHDTLTDGDRIAAYNQLTGTLGWEPAKFHRYDFDGELVKIEKRDTSQRLTADHRCLVKRRVSGIDVVLAKNLKPGMDVPLTAPLIVQEASGPGLEFAALLGWYVTEGEKKRGNIVRINQSLSANPKKVDEIRRLLVSLGAEFREACREREWRGRPSVEVTFHVRGAVAKRLHTMSADKRIDWAWLSWPIDDVTVFVNAVIDGDGHRRRDGRRCVVQKDRAFMDVLQAMTLRLGWRSHISPRPEGWTLFITDGEWLTLRGTNGTHEPIGREAYTGTVWCPSVASTFWLARRNGKPFITGNTFPPALIEPCILAGCAEGGTVLDPFGGAGTTGLVADRLQRSAILIELNPEYAAMAEKRIHADGPLFSDITNA